MTKKMIAIYFGLVVLVMSLFASTAFAVNNPGPGTTQVVVTNSPAQPVPMVGITKDSDAPARKPFQPPQISFDAPDGFTRYTVGTVPAGYRLVLEHASGYCNSVSSVAFSALVPGYPEDSGLFLPQDVLTGKFISAPVRLYVNPGDTLQLVVTNTTGQAGYCKFYVSGYYVALP
jgi:hypothetical protein